LRVVTVFAHWKGADVVADDVPGTVAEFARRLTDAASGNSAELRAQLVAAAERRHVVDVLNAALHVPEAPRDGVTEVVEHADSRAARRRAEIDDLFAGLLRPGNRLELFDGMHDAAAVEAAIAPEFAGVLDLPVCHSTVIADYISWNRCWAPRIVQAPAAVDVEWAAKCVSGTLELLGSGAYDYLEARQMARATMESEVKRAWRRRLLNVFTRKACVT
jgi:hypothetical protein